MSKRMIRMWPWVVAAIVAFVFVSSLYGCATGTTGETTEQEITDNTESGQQNYDSSYYGEVESIDGSNVTVLLGEIDGSPGNASGDTGEGEERVPDVSGFVAGTEEITFDSAVIDLMDENGAAIESNSLKTGDILSLKGTGAEANFVPMEVQIIGAPAS